MSRLMYCLSRQQRAHCCRHSSLLSASCLQRFDTRQQATRSAGSRNDRTSSSPSDGNNPRMSILCSLNSVAAAWPQLWVSISTTRYLALPVHQTLPDIDSLVARYERTLTSTATTLRLLRLLFWWWDTNSKHGWQTRGNVSEKAKNACRVRGHAVVELATTCDSATRTPTRCSTCKLNRSKKQNGRHMNIRVDLERCLCRALALKEDRLHLCVVRSNRITYHSIISPFVGASTS